MDINEKIQLRKFEYVDAINQDSSVKVSLDKSNRLLTEYDVNTTLDVSQVFDDERQATEIYRFHGQFQYFSITNNLNDEYASVEDILTKPYNGDGITRRNVLSDFKFYLVKPVPPEGYFHANGDISNGYGETNVENRYYRSFEVIATYKEFDIYKAGFGRNIFNEQQYAYNLFGEIDIKDQVDGFGIPLTEVFIYAEYQPSRNGNNVHERVKVRGFNNVGDNGTLSSNVSISNPFQELEIGDVIDGDVVEFNPADFSQTVYNNKTYNVYIPTSTTFETEELLFKYNPFIPIQLRVLSDLRRVSLDSTDYAKIDSIPSHALDLGGEDYVWRDLLDKGFIDPLTLEGVNHPFINQRHYVFSNLIIELYPEMADNFTNSKLGNTIYGVPALLQNKPQNLDNLGDKC